MYAEAFLSASVGRLLLLRAFRRSILIKMIRQHIRRLLLPAACLLSFLFFAVPVSAAALPPTTTFAATCPSVSGAKNTATTPYANASNGESCIFSNYINPLVKFMAALAGLAVIVSVIWGAILYQTSAGDSGKVAKAKGHIYQAFIALFAFLFLIAFLEWLLPGGINGKGS